MFGVLDQWQLSKIPRKISSTCAINIPIKRWFDAVLAVWTGSLQPSAMMRSAATEQSELAAGPAVEMGGGRKDV